MAKWADFVVSAVQKGSGLANISHVQIHEDLEHGFGPPQLIDKHQLSSKIQRGITFITVYKKNENEWASGELIRTYVKDGEAHIRTDDNKVDGDNLGHIPTVDELEIIFTEVEKEEPKIIPPPPPEPIPEPEPEPEPKPTVEIPKVNVDSGDYEYEDSRREILAKSAEAARSQKSLPKGWSTEKAATDEKEIIKNEVEKMREKLHQKETRDKEFVDYEKKYLEEMEKSQTQNKKLKDELKQAEEILHKARIARRLELEKVSGKDYEKLLSETRKPEPEPTPKSESVDKKITENKDDTKDKLSVESRISGMLKRIISTKDSSSETAIDTRNFIRKKRTAPQPEPESKPKESKPKESKPKESKPKESKPKESKPKESKPNSPKLSSTISTEDKKRELLAKEALELRSTKSLPKDTPKKEDKKTKKVQEKEIAEIKAQAMEEAKKQAEAEAEVIRNKFQKEIDDAKSAQEQLRKEVEEIKLAKEKLERIEKERKDAEARIAQEKLEKELAKAKAAKEELERQEAEEQARIEAEERAKREAEEKAAAEAKYAQEKLQRELDEAKAAKEELERQEAEEQARRQEENTSKVDLATEIQNELNELRKQLNEAEAEESDEDSQNELIIRTLKTAVAKGWTKTITVQKLRKSTGMTVKKAREYASEVFG